MKITSLPVILLISIAPTIASAACMITGSSNIDTQNFINCTNQEMQQQQMQQQMQQQQDQMRRQQQQQEEMQRQMREQQEQMRRQQQMNMQ